MPLHISRAHLLSWLLLALPAAALAQTQRVTITSGTMSLPIADLGTTIHTLRVPLVGTVNDVNVSVRLNHTFLADLILTLIHPDGTRVVLANRPGANFDNYGSLSNNCEAAVFTVFDDEAPTEIANGTPPFNGLHDPEGDLGVFDTRPAYGDWKLEIVDASSDDTGTLGCYIVDINTVFPGAFIDVDGNGTGSALSDGLLIVRWLFGLRGETLTSGAIGAGCTRCSFHTIEPFLQQLDGGAL